MGREITHSGEGPRQKHIHLQKQSPAEKVRRGQAGKQGEGFLVGCGAEGSAVLFKHLEGEGKAQEGTSDAGRIVGEKSAPDRS